MHAPGGRQHGARLGPCVCFLYSFFSWREREEIQSIHTTVECTHTHTIAYSLFAFRLTFVCTTAVDLAAKCSPQQICFERHRPYGAWAKLIFRGGLSLGWTFYIAREKEPSISWWGSVYGLRTLHDGGWWSEWFWCGTGKRKCVADKYNCQSSGKNLVFFI